MFDLDSHNAIPILTTHGEESKDYSPKSQYRQSFILNNPFSTSLTTPLQAQLLSGEMLQQHFNLILS
jgi:hypothetical protein